MSNIDLTAWNDAYRIGHHTIDAEHRKLFSIANKIVTCPEDLGEMKKILLELADYTKIHFTNEEQYMHGILYPDLTNHTQLHKNIITKLNIILKKFNSLDATKVKQILQKFVSENIVNHILTEDKKVHHFRRDKSELRTFFKWRDSFLVDDELIDAEHKKLFEIAVRALSFPNKEIRKHIKKTLAELYDYMIVHFDNEEHLMEKIEYPRLEEHKKKHQRIVTQMNDFVKSSGALSSEDFERKLIEYMDVWLVSHIISEDKKILDFKKSKSTVHITS